MSFFNRLSDSVFNIFKRDTKEELKIEKKVEPKEVEVLSEIDTLKKEFLNLYYGFFRNYNRELLITLFFNINKS